MTENATSERIRQTDNQLIEALKQIKANDNVLASRLRDALWLPHPFGDSQTVKECFAKDVQNHVNDMAKIATDAFNKDPSEYFWLEDAAARWKFVCETAVGMSIELPIFGERLLELASLDNRGISRFVQLKAHKISESRRYAKALKILEEIMRTKYQETTPDEERWDWLQAERYFAKDVLYGTGDLYRYMELGDVRASEIWKYFHHDTFNRLENIWLSDVFDLRAYECWIERGSPITSDMSVIGTDYKKASSQFWDRMLDDTVKYPLEARGALTEYLEKKLGLGKGPIFEEQQPFLTLIDRRSRRIDELGGQKDKRRRATNYVTGFYRALYGAVVTDNNEAKRRVAVHFKSGLGDSDNRPIASCFEALVMVYYVRGARDAFAAG